MGFIYTKSCSIEEVFGKFDTNHDGKISRDEVNAAKGMDIFTNFKVKKGMTLETFENTNKDVYAKYEKAATYAYNKQQEKVKQWIKDEQTALVKFQDQELAKLEEVEKELEIELKKLDKKAQIQSEAYKYGFKFSEDELNNLSDIQLIEKLDIFKLIQENLKK